ncbi:hypothetical protein EIP86_003431 [Pleurotus ostreatoroseus]|nr:hypothetical protein EIP86_003431 [Pleurotus ostreatoroseus]
MASSSTSSTTATPTTRSRTLLFLSFRDSRASSSRFRRPRTPVHFEDTAGEDEQDRLIDPSVAHVAIDADFPPRWADVASQVEDILAGAQAKISALDKLHAKHALPGFADRSAEEREIEAATTEVTKDFRRCHALIQQIGAVPDHAFPPSNTHQQASAAKNVQRGLAAKVQELSATFRKKQRVYLEKLQGHAIKNQDLLVASGAISLKGSEGLTAVDEDVAAATASRGGALAQDLLTADMDLRARDRELSEIAKSIASLAELFKDLSALVIDQGTLLDSVEYNIEQTAVQMSEAVKELNVATRTPIDVAMTTFYPEGAPSKPPGHPRSSDSMSIRSDSPLRSSPYTTYPPLPSQQASSSREELRNSRHVRLVDSPSRMSRSLRNYDTNSSATTPMMPQPGQSSGLRPESRSNSWDVMAGIRKIEHSYEEFDSRNASKAHLAFAEGDIPNNRFAKFYNYLLNVSIVTRWFLFIVPVMGILWIPGILGLTNFPDARVRSIHSYLRLEVLTEELGMGRATPLVECMVKRCVGSMIMPRVARNSIGVVAVAARRYIDWLEALHRYVALFGWTLACWVAYQPLILTRQASNTSSGSVSVIQLIAKLLFAMFLCAAVLLGEKFAIQFIASKFHERSYAGTFTSEKSPVARSLRSSTERIADQKFAVGVLTTLYRHSHDIPGRTDTLKDGTADKRASMDPKRFLKKAFKGVKSAATTTTTVLGTVASEIAGTSVLQPNSPQAKVQTALQSANKSRLLARRLFYSFVRPNAEYLVIGDIARYFPTMEDADAAFAIFDQDSNGDATRDEIEMACLEFHREQLSIEHSMQDLDSAVGRLDNILMSVYFVVAILIIAVALEAQLATLITSAGTLVLGLSWLIGSSLSNVLTSIIFLFVKHPYDVGDRVQIETDEYVVKEIRLLSTIFLDSRSCYVQAPNTELDEKFIMNIRRSPQMSESFTWDVAYSTTFDQISRLRGLMLAYLDSERRDYQPAFDVVVVDIPDQTKMTLKVDIKYKSNWQQGALKSRRRNKWICALKSAMVQVRMFGPDGDPGARGAPTPYTLVPWEEAKETFHPPRAPSPSPGGLRETKLPETWSFSDHNAMIVDDSQDVFGEKDELYMKQPVRLPSGPDPRQRPVPVSTPSMDSMLMDPLEEVELKTPRAPYTFTDQQV